MFRIFENSKDKSFNDNQYDLKVIKDPMLH